MAVVHAGGPPRTLPQARLAEAKRGATSEGSEGPVGREKPARRISFDRLGWR